MSMTGGTPLSSQIIFLEQRVEKLEEQNAMLLSALAIQGDKGLMLEFVDDLKKKALFIFGEESSYLKKLVEDIVEWYDASLKIAINGDTGTKLELSHGTSEVLNHQPWCNSLTQMLLSYPPQPAPCNCVKKEQEIIKPKTN